MNRSTLAITLSSLLSVACSAGYMGEDTRADISASVPEEGALEEPGVTGVPLSVDESTPFCELADTLEGGVCRINSTSEPSPFKWTLCNADTLRAAISPNYYVPFCTSDTPLVFRKRPQGGAAEVKITVNRAKYVACTRDRYGFRHGRAIVYARASVPHVVLEAYNPASDWQAPTGYVEYDNRRYAGQAPLLEAVILSLNPATNEWRESGRTVLPNDQTNARVDGYVPRNSLVKLEVRGHQNVTGEPEATIINARLILPNACTFDEATQTCF